MCANVSVYLLGEQGFYVRCIPLHLLWRPMRCESLNKSWFRCNLWHVTGSKSHSTFIEFKVPIGVLLFIPRRPIPAASASFSRQINKLPDSNNMTESIVSMKTLRKRYTHIPSEEDQRDKWERMWTRCSTDTARYAQIYVYRLIIICWKNSAPNGKLHRHARSCLANVLSLCNVW